MMVRWKASNENIQVLPSKRKFGSEGHKTGGGGGDFTAGSQQSKVY